MLVLRGTPERREVIDGGAGRIVGTGTARIVDEASRQLSDSTADGARSSKTNPFGDGRAAERIADFLEQTL